MSEIARQRKNARARQVDVQTERDGEGGIIQRERERATNRSEGLQKATLPICFWTLLKEMGFLIVIVWGESERIDPTWLGRRGGEVERRGREQDGVVWSVVVLWGG